MASTTIPKRLFQRLIFGDDATAPESLEAKFDMQDELREEKDGTKKPSAYVLVFEGMVGTIIQHEHGLLSEQEINVLEQIGKLSYNTRYCLVRLVLRKANQWHPVSTLRSYIKEIGEQGLKISIEDLCKPITTILKEEPSEPQVKPEPMDVPLKAENEREVVDLTLDSEDEEGAKPNARLLTKPTFGDYWANQPSTSMLPLIDPIQALFQSNCEEANLDFFCEDEGSMTLDEILWRLTNEQLLGLIKQMKCKPKTKSLNKPEIISALKKHAYGQRILPFTSTPNKNTNKKTKGKSQDDGWVQTPLPRSFISKKSVAPVSQAQRLRDMALEKLGKCVRVNFDFYRLVRRLHIIYYRETEHPDALLLPSLLTTFKKRAYTVYDITRSKDIWYSREDLLAYEKALELEQLLEEIQNPPPEKGRQSPAKTPGRVRDQFKTPVAEVAFPTPLRTPANALCIRQSQTPSVKEEECLYLPGQPLEAEVEGQIVEVKKEEKIKEHFETWVHPTWKGHVEGQATKSNVKDRPLGLQRFEPGHVYTRMVWKACKVLGTLREYEAESEALNGLLSQHFWSRGKRGRFYERRAIVLGHLSNRADTPEDKQGLLWQSMEGLKEALRDPDTGLVHRPGFVKRLMALEKRLKIPLDERTQCAAKLQDANVVEFKAKKLPSTGKLLLDESGQPIIEKENAPNAGIHAYMPVHQKDGTDTIKAEPVETSRKNLGKSKWEGRDGKIVDVETRALEYYEIQGYKGFHSETRLLTTIFGLLLWDIIFMNIPGAFETAFQSCPLDMFEDSFYYAREAQINARLQEIEAGRAREILERHDDMYREKKTWCLCVSWDICTKGDLIEIIDCFKPSSLAQICKVFCQDYRGRSSGGPDLFLWKPTERSCKFVEVKGPGDIARENQKLWFDALVQAGVDVEICKVLDQNYKPSPSTSRKRKPKSQTPNRQRQRKKLAHDETFSEEEDYDQMDPEPEEENAKFSPLDLPALPRKRPRITGPLE